MANNKDHHHPGQKSCHCLVMDGVDDNDDECHDDDGDGDDECHDDDGDDNENVFDNKCYLIPPL